VAEITEYEFVGDWRVTVSSRNAGWNQRVVAADTADGDRFLAGAPGSSMDVIGSGATPWTLRIEHDDGSGWAPSWLRPASSISGVRLEYSVASEDDTDSSSDRDFDDLVVRLQKLGCTAQDVPPFAVRPETLQAMPEGIFEATLGRYFMAVRLTNIWTLAWPPGSRVGLTTRCRAWLTAAGVRVIDAWSLEDERALGQSVIGGQVVVGGLPAWESRTVYFKVDVSEATVRKHQVELQLHDGTGVGEDLGLLSRRAKAPIQVSRTTYDPARAAFVSRCDVGTLTASVKELTVDLATFKRTIATARSLRDHLGVPGGGATPDVPGVGACGDARTLEWVRGQLRAFLDGKDVDLCALYRLVACCCAGGRPGDDGDGGSWTEFPDPGLSFFAWPTVVDYGIEYDPPFTGQFGPIPFDDPWWKILLAIIALILSLAAAASSTADLANRSDDTVIGTLTRSVLNPLSSAPTTPPPSTDAGSVDAAVVALNGNRSLTSAVFTLMDAETGEHFTADPVVALDGRIDLPGTTITNAGIDTILQNLAENPGDPAAQAAVRAYKSGARSGLGRGVIGQVLPVAPRQNDEGVVSYFLNQLHFEQDGETSDSLSCAGDSGSLWIQEGTNAVLALNHGGPVDESGSFGLATRIEDVINQLGIRFA
jgi:hypothetical protein